MRRMWANRMGSGYSAGCGMKCRGGSGDGGEKQSAEEEMMEKRSQGVFEDDGGGGRGVAGGGGGEGRVDAYSGAGRGWQLGAARQPAAWRRA